MRLVRRAIWGIHAGVGGALIFWHIRQVWRGNDFNCYDDLTRTILAQDWCAHPFFFTPDVYWLPLPFAVRGALMGAWGAVFGVHADAMIFIARLVSLLYMFGAWVLLARCVRLLGGGFFGILAYAIFYCLSFGTMEFSASALSEPDLLFWTALLLSLLIAGERRGSFSTDRHWAIGACAMLCCLIRYEGWTLAFAVSGVLLWRELKASDAALFSRGTPKALECGSLLPLFLRKALGFSTNVSVVMQKAEVSSRTPKKFSQQAHSSVRHGRGLSISRIVPLLLPLIPVAIWMTGSAVKLGSPVRFLGEGSQYIDALGSEGLAWQAFHAVWKNNYLLVPIFFGCGATEFFRGFGAARANRQLHRLAADAHGQDAHATQEGNSGGHHWLALIVSVFGAWMIFKLLKLNPTARFTWDFSMLVSVAGAAYLGREMRALSANPPDRRAVILLLFILPVTAIRLLPMSQRPYLNHEIRTLACEAGRHANGGAIYFDEGAGAPFDSSTVLAALRVYAPPARVIPCNWIQACDGLIDSEKVARYELQIAVAPSLPPGLSTDKEPLIRAFQWQVLKLDRDQSAQHGSINP